jgi:hypothetical protein
MENTTQLSTPTLSTRILQTLNVLGFALMLFMNFLAVSLPLNGKTTGELSVKYENLFVPTGATFSIWGIIYLLLLLFSIYQASSIFSSEPNKPSTVVTQLSVWYLVSSLLNALWIVAWHYEFVPISVAIMLLLLASLIVINLEIAKVSGQLSGGVNLLVKSSFGIYLGWICVATIANITAWLTAIGWTGGFEQDTWTVIILFIGGVIGLFAAIKLNNGFISLALIWALGGIVLKRLDSDPIYYSIIAIAGVFIFIHTINALVRLYRMNKEKFVEKESLQEV